MLALCSKKPYGIIEHGYWFVCFINHDGRILLSCIPEFAMVVLKFHPLAAAISSIEFLVLDWIMHFNNNYGNTLVWGVSWGGRRP